MFILVRDDAVDVDGVAGQTDHHARTERAADIATWLEPVEVCAMVGSRHAGTRVAGCASPCPRQPGHRDRVREGGLPGSLEDRPMERF